MREKLQDLAESVKAEGWKWVEIDPEFDYRRASAMASIDTVPKELNDQEQQQLDRLQERLELLSNDAEQDDPSEETLAKIDRLEQEIATLTEEVYRPEDIARAGVFIALGHRGEARIERGYLRPEDARQEEGEGGGEVEAGSIPVRDKDGLSGALIAELTAHRTAALRNDLAQVPELALIAVTHALAARAFYHETDLSCLGLSLNQSYLVGVASRIDESIAGQAIAARHEAWVSRMPKESAELWSFVGSLSMDDLLSLLAHCASLSLNAVRRAGDGSHDGALAHADTLAKAMPHDMSRYWHPTAESYLGRVSKDRIREAVRQGAGDQAARQIEGLKKQAMAQRAEQLLSGKGWLPVPLRQAVAVEDASAA